MCLWCHATGAHVEEWEKDEAFIIEEGVQCEKCHGPGSEYMDVMMNREMAMKAGLMEIADLFVINKADRQGANQALAQIQSMLEMRHPQDGIWSPVVVKQSM